jgi:hypothetical protein
MSNIQSEDLYQYLPDIDINWFTEETISLMKRGPHHVDTIPGTLGGPTIQLKTDPIIPEFYWAPWMDHDIKG